MVYNTQHKRRRRLGKFPGAFFWFRELAVIGS